MSERIDPKSRIGEVHEAYTIVDVVRPLDPNDNRIYSCRCNTCGRIVSLKYWDVKKIKHCNHFCYGTPRVTNNRWSNNFLRDIFAGMKERCYNKNNKCYRWYGAKGIKICDEWLSNPSNFEIWAIDNGYKDGLTIDRIDENKNYCPENCQWITRQENTKYKSTTSRIEVNGEMHTGRDWAAKLGLGTNLINKYIRKYGLESTIDFIKRVQENPTLKNYLKPNQTLYSLYCIS